MGALEVRFYLERGTKMFDGPVVFTASLDYGAGVVMRIGTTGIDADRGLIGLQGGVAVAFLAEHVADVDQGVQVPGIDRQNLSVQLQRLAQTARFLHGIGEIGHCRRMTGLQLEDLVQRFDRRFMAALHGEDRAQTQ